MTLSRHFTSRHVMRICMEAKSTAENVLQFKVHALQWSLVAVITNSSKECYLYVYFVLRASEQDFTGNVNTIGEESVERC